MDDHVVRDAVVCSFGCSSQANLAIIDSATMVRSDMAMQVMIKNRVSPTAIDY